MSCCVVTMHNVAPRLRQSKKTNKKVVNIGMESQYPSVVSHNPQKTTPNKRIQEGDF